MAKLRESKGEPQIYQLSQRGDFFEELVGLQTTHNRPIINTRDEPHADRQKYMRLHVICGDANLSEVSTYLKTGTTALVLDLLEDGLLPEIALDNPLKTIQNISRDQTRRWTVDLKEGKKTTALEVQRAYLQAAKDAYYGRDGITDDVLSRWETTLNALETDPMQLAGSIDWVIKLNLLTHMMDRHGVNMNDAKIKTAALQYHDIDPSKGLFYYLQNHEMAERLVTDAEIEHAMTHGPLDTRAYLRSRVASIPEVSSVDWGGFSLRVGNSTKSISLDEPFSGREEQVRVLLDHYSGPEGLLEGLKQVEGISVSDYVFTSPAGKKGKKSRKGRGKGTSTSFPTPFDRSYGDEEIGFTGMPDRIGEWDPDIEDRLRR
jgi:proteasome accessory factor A